MSDYRSELFLDVELSSAEREIIENIKAGITPNGTGLSISFEINKVLSSIYSAKKSEKTGKGINTALIALVNQLIQANVAANKTSRRMFWLTVALFSVGAVQALATVAEVLINTIK